MEISKPNLAPMSHMTTTGGNPIADNQNSLSAGPRGPLLMQDYQLLEKLAHQNRERVPERTVHAKGSGAFGTFTVTHDITRYTKASIFAGVGKQTPALLRFSTVAGERGAADAERDVRGFALKFYPDQGNWDMVGNNTPVFFVRDPLKFPDFIHTQKRHPRTNLRSPTAMWDFWSLSPESLHQVTILFSDRGLPKSYRHVNGYGSHTYSFLNAKNERFWVKFHFKTQQGIQTMTNAEGEALIAEDRESSQRDLYEAIENGDFPKWKVQVQVMPELDADTYPIHPFDITKVWPHKDYPMIDVGVLELNRNPENYFAEIEQSAFSPSNIVPGISFSPDKMLQSRLFAYGDAQRYRLGVNHHHIPVNAPRCPFNSYHRDGAMRTDGNRGGVIGYEPNSREQWVEQPDFAEPPLALDGAAAGHWDHRADEDYFTQAGDLFRLMSPAQQQILFENTARSVGGASKAVQRRHVEHCRQADPAYGAGVEKALCLGTSPDTPNAVI